MNVLALVTISFVVLKLKKILLHENYKEAAVAIMAFIERVMIDTRVFRIYCILDRRIQ